MKYLIDGYNVVHQIENLQGKRLRSQREGLIRLLEIAQAQHSRLKDLTVVFDGKTEVSAPRVNSTVKIIFTRGKSADKKIQEIIRSSNHARDIAVVSDDREIKSFAGRVRAKKISVRQFLQMVSRAPIEQKQHSFKLDDLQAEKINQELEKIWLNK